MSLQRRGGRRFIRKQKVNREEMVKFHQGASRLERTRLAERRAIFLGKWLQRFVWALAIGAAIGAGIVKFG